MIERSGWIVGTTHETLAMSVEPDVPVHALVLDAVGLGVRDPAVGDPRGCASSVLAQPENSTSTVDVRGRRGGLAQLAEAGRMTS